MTNNNTNNTPPGWHPDPSNPNQLRWWDGNQWTNNTHPIQSPSSPQSTKPQPNQAPPAFNPDSSPRTTVTDVNNNPKGKPKTIGDMTRGQQIAMGSAAAFLLLIFLIIALPGSDDKSITSERFTPDEWRKASLSVDASYISISGYAKSTSACFKQFSAQDNINNCLMFAEDEVQKQMDETKSILEDFADNKAQACSASVKRMAKAYDGLNSAFLLSGAAYDDNDLKLLRSALASQKKEAQRLNSAKAGFTKTCKPMAKKGGS